MDGHIILHVNHLGTIVLAGRAVFATIASHHARRALNTVNRGNPKPIESIDYPKTLGEMTNSSTRNRRNAYLLLRRRVIGVIGEIVELWFLHRLRFAEKKENERERERDDRDGWGDFLSSQGSGVALEKYGHVSVWRNGGFH